MKMYVRSSIQEDSRYYLSAILQSLGLQYDGLRSTQISQLFGELSYAVSSRNGCYYLDVWIRSKDDPDSGAIAEQVFDTIEDCIHEFRMQSAYLQRYDPSDRYYGSRYYIAHVRRIPKVAK